MLIKRMSTTEQFLPLIQCYTCGTILPPLYEKYQQLLASGNSPEQALNLVGAKRYCCRARILDAPPLPAGLMVEDDIEALQRKLNRFYFEPQKTKDMHAVLPAMKTQIGIGYNNSQTVIQVTEAPRSVRIYSSTLGKPATIARPREPLLYDNFAKVVLNAGFSEMELQTSLLAKGITEETKNKYSYILKRNPDMLEFDVLKLNTIIKPAFK